MPALPTGHELVMATDGHVISPLFFPGGDIGSLAVHGTVNDVAMMGATPLYLSASFILEEGFALAELQRIVQSMAAAARAAGVPVELRVWPGVIHDFINMGRFLPEAAQAHTALAEALKKAFAA